MEMHAVLCTQADIRGHINVQFPNAYFMLCSLFFSHVCYVSVICITRMVVIELKVYFSWSSEHDSSKTVEF